MKYSLSALPSCHQSGCFLGIQLLDFSEFLHGARNPYEAVCDRVRLFGKKLGKWNKNRPKIGFFEFKEKFGH